MRTYDIILSIWLSSLFFSNTNESHFTHSPKFSLLYRNKIYHNLGGLEVFHFYMLLYIIRNMNIALALVSFMAYMYDV